jgi:hypothetical protein
MREVNERSSCTFLARFRNTTGALSAPGTARYRVWNVTSGRVLLDWTAIATPAATETIIVPASLNVTQTGQRLEIIELAVQSDYDDDDEQQTQAIRYRLRNLPSVEDSG